MEGKPISIGILNRIVARPRPPTKPCLLVVVERLDDALTIVHDEGPILDDGLPDWPALHHQELDLTSEGAQLQTSAGVDLDTGASFSLSLLTTVHNIDLRRRTIKEIKGAVCIGDGGGGEYHRTLGAQADVPDSNVGFRPGSPRVWRGRLWRGLSVAKGTGNDGYLGSRCPISSHDARSLLGPVHREVGVDHLVGGRQVEPDLEQLEGVRARCGSSGKHLGVLTTPAPAVIHWVSPGRIEPSPPGSRRDRRAPVRT